MRAEGHAPVLDNRQTEQGHLLPGHHRFAAAFPVRIGPAAAAQVSAQRLQPGHVNGRRLAGKQARGLHHLRRHDPVARILEQARTGEKHHLAILGRPEEHLFFFHGDVGQKPAQDGTVNGGIQGMKRPVVSLAARRQFLKGLPVAFHGTEALFLQRWP